MTTLCLKTRSPWNLSKHSRKKSLQLLCLSHTATDITFSFAKSLDFELPAPPTLCQGSFQLLEPALPLCGEGQNLWGINASSPPLSSPPSITDWCLGITIPSPSTLGQDGSEVGFIHWLPEFSRIKLQEPTVVTQLMMCSLKTSFPSRSYSQKGIS